MPTYENPITDATEAYEALRGLAHATRSWDEPADTYRVIGEVGTAAEQREILRLIVVAVELVGAAHDVAQNRAVHILTALFSARPRRCGASSQR